MQGRAILLYEKSMFQRKKKRRRKGNAPVTATEPDASDSDSNSDSDDEGCFGLADADSKAIYCKDFVKEPNDGKEWGKSVDPIMRQYISTKLCRRDMTDRYFNNPPRKPPTGECCDNCVRNAMVSASSSAPSRPTTPERQSPPSSAHSTPSKDRNANGKRPIVRGEPRTRRKLEEHLKSAREALEPSRTLAPPDLPRKI
ncbi:hypothetical protein GGX14DRAFT_572569 [Mycena pura]|uniref:Uncharacterized protein n=1 Tax=Mycena pura TaxID=153505 RepID=A0AAD6V0M1_9AGAR|nr:hypothetical protein GGX14DRAFT_572569 [Mycena pura]